MDSIKLFLSQKHIAVAGVSQSRRKFGSMVYEHLKKRGYNVYPINPSMNIFNDDKCYPNLESLPDDVTAFVAVTRPEITVKLIHEAARCNISMVWMQKGTGSMEAIEVAKNAGMVYITSRCIMMFAEPVKSIHGFHRFIAKLFGKYPK